MYVKQMEGNMRKYTLTPPVGWVFLSIKISMMKLNICVDLFNPCQAEVLKEDGLAWRIFESVSDYLHLKHDLVQVNPIHQLNIFR